MLVCTNVERNEAKRRLYCIVLCCVIRVLSTACVLTIHVRMGVIYFFLLYPLFFIHSHVYLFLFIYYSIFLDPSSELDTGNENAEKERMWVMRGRNSAIAVTCGWITWILFVQVIFPDSLPSSWYVRDPNSFAATGW